MRPSWVDVFIQFSSDEAADNFSSRTVTVTGGAAKSPLAQANDKNAIDFSEVRCMASATVGRS